MLVQNIKVGISTFGKLAAAATLSASLLSGGVCAAEEGFDVSIMNLGDADSVWQVFDVMKGRMLGDYTEKFTTDRLSYRARPIIGNNEESSLDVPLPVGELPKKLRLDIPIDLVINISKEGEPSLFLEGESNVISRIIPQVNDEGELVLFLSKPVEANDRIKAFLSLPALDTLHNVSKSNVEIFGLVGERFYVTNSGLGKIRAMGKVKILNANIRWGHANFAVLEVEEDLLLKVGNSSCVKVNAENSVLQTNLSPNAHACYVGQPRENINSGAIDIKPCNKVYSESETYPLSDMVGAEY